MGIDYIVASLPALAFGAEPALSQEQFAQIAQGVDISKAMARWRDLETQLRNEMARARGAEKWVRPCEGCSLFWRNRVAACFQEKDVAKRDELLDRVWWDAAGELIPPAEPLGKGTLAAYSIRLAIAHKRAAISREKGESALDRQLAATANVI